MYLDDVISFGMTEPEGLQRLVEVLERLSTFGLQLKAKKCTFMQTEVAFLGHIYLFTISKHLNIQIIINSISKY